MSDKKVISFDEYVADDDITVEEVETKRGTIVKMGSCSSADILEWFEENDAVLEDGKPDHDKRKFKGLRLIVRASSTQTARASRKRCGPPRSPR
jgi:hypothetical protein